MMPLIQSGSFLVYRVFDIAEEVDLDRLLTLLKEEAKPGRLKLTHSIRQQVIMRNAPTTIELGGTTFDFAGKTYKAETYAKIWDYGVLSIQFEIPLRDVNDANSLYALAHAIEQSQAIDDLARKHEKELVQTLGPALKDPHDWEEFEDYCILFIEKGTDLERAENLFQKIDVARLILAEPAAHLSERAKKPILESTFQYFEDDLTVIDWNSAVVVDPSGKKDVPEVIEFALTHMMEMRYYDKLIDQRLADIYDSIEESRGKMLRNRFSDLSREASARYIEFSEFIERVDNSFKVVGDFYLARIFRAAGEEFRMPEWESTISRKMQSFASISELLQGEINVNRSLWLEITIVLLIAFEIASTFIKWVH